MGISIPSTWYKDAVIYEVHVRAFADSNGDGIGDFSGLTGKLDYLHDLGVTAIWLLPFFPSPLLDDGYDIADYTSVHPAYGTLDEFRAFLEAAHERGLRVIIELVLNHTSDQHPWFQRARRAPNGSPEREFYVWSESADRYGDARVIFRDYEQSNWAWDATANAWYWHRFYRHQPDLNYDNPAVREAMFEVVDFWLELGVDGLRLDAVPYLVEEEGTTSENLPGTHVILKELRRRIEAKYPDRMLLAEANQWPEDAVAYFGDGDECHMAFHFPLMPRLFMALRTEDRLPLIDIMAQTPVIPETCQWALFLRNHDELTLEMVTDEERLSMIRAYAPREEARINLGIRHRLAPLLGNSRRRIELMNALLCALPGTPVIYYGDEIGMGDNIYLGDRDGVRTPMQWNADRNAGFSAAPPQQLYLPLIVDYEYHHAALHVEAQQQNAHSLLAFMKRLLLLRKQSRAFGRGSFNLLDPANHRVLAFIREYEEEMILVVANLSRFSQTVELDLRAYGGRTPIEVFGRIPFGTISDALYPLTLGPHGFYWFRLDMILDSESGSMADPRRHVLPVISTTGAWDELITGRHRGPLEQVLLELIGRQPWFRRSPDLLLNVRLLDALPVPNASPATWIVPVRATFSERDPEMYLMGLALLELDDGNTSDDFHGTPIARVQSETHGDAALIDAIGEGLIGGILRWLADDPTTPLQGEIGQLLVERIQQDAPLEHGESGCRSSPPADADGDNPIFQSGEMVVKFLRRLNEGVNPEWELGRALTNQGFGSTPSVLGALQYVRPHHPPMTVAVLQRHIPNNGHGWDFAAGFLDGLVARTDAQKIVTSQTVSRVATELLAAVGTTPPDPLADLLAPWCKFAALIGKRTADLHRALASVDSRPAFVPEPYTAHDRRSINQSMRGLTVRALRSLRLHAPKLAEDELHQADILLEHEQDFYQRYQGLLNVSSQGFRIRCHGDFHLGQVLLTGDDITFVDFEGEPDRLLDERRLKTSPLRDVTSMLHSFEVAALHAKARHAAATSEVAEQHAMVDTVIDSWCWYGAAAFLGAYLDAAGPDQYLPATFEDRATMMDAFLLERAVYELDYFLRHRPNELALPLVRVAQLITAV